MLSIRYKSCIESCRNRKTSLRAVLREIIWKNNGDCSCLNCLYSFRTKKIMVIVVVSVVSISFDKKKVESHKKLCEKKDFCNIVMSSEDNKILEFNQYKKNG